MTTAMDTRRVLLSGIILAASILIAAFILTGNIHAQPENIVFPIAELGNCESKEACKTYCDKKDNFERCINFAEKNGLMSKIEATHARKAAKALNAEERGPGGCKSEKECKAYCEDMNHINECLAFAEKHGLMPPEELQEARKVARALREGTRLPGGCTNKAACENYCEDPAHMDECIAFAENAGFMTKEEADMVRKTGGVGPGGCRGRACQTYCDDPDHFNECIAFAETNGLIGAEEARIARLTGGKGPGGCQREECRTYCDDLSHAKECVDFALAHGMMKPEEAEMALKMMQRGITSGPGGCQGKNECETFCNDPANMEACMNFAVEAGFMTPEEAEHVKKMGTGILQGGPGGCQGQLECQRYCEDPAHQDECIVFSVEAGFMTPEEAERVKSLEGGFSAGGPGGCKSELECKDYCSRPEHQEECFAFAKEHGLIDEGASLPESEVEFREYGDEYPVREGAPTQTFTGGPGGCQTPEECKRYCSDPSHVEECKSFFPEKFEESGPTYPSPEEGYTYPAEPSPEDSSLSEPIPHETSIPQEQEFQEPTIQEPIIQEPAPTYPAGPGGCATPEECRIYCSDPLHYQECGIEVPSYPGASILNALANLSRAAIGLLLSLFR